MKAMYKILSNAKYETGINQRIYKHAHTCTRILHVCVQLYFDYLDTHFFKISAAAFKFSSFFIKQYRT